MQLELGNLEEGDISIHGRAIVDVKKLTQGQAPRLSAEVVLVGPLDRPEEWRGTFVAGDEHIQHLVDRLLERGVKVIRLTPWGNKVSMSMVPSSKEVMTDIEMASKEVREALEILSAPEEVPAPAPTFTAVAPGEPTTPMIAPAAEAPIAQPPSAAPTPVAPATGESHSAPVSAAPTPSQQPASAPPPPTATH